MPEYLYAYNEDGERYDDSVIGSKFEAHWYDPNTIGAGPYRFITFGQSVKSFWKEIRGIHLEEMPMKILFQIRRSTTARSKNEKQ